MSYNPEEFESIKERLKQSTLSNQWEHTLEKSPLIESQKRDLRIEMRNTIETMIDRLSILTTPEELQIQLAHNYIEKKSKWLMLNTTIQYNQLLFDREDTFLNYRASMISHITGMVEEFLPEQDVKNINSFLADPAMHRLTHNKELTPMNDHPQIEQVQPDGEQTEGGLQQQLFELYREKELLGKELGFADPDQIIETIRSLEQQLQWFYLQKDANKNTEPERIEEQSREKTASNGLSEGQDDEISDIEFAGAGIRRSEDESDLQDQIESMNQQLNNLYEEKERLFAGLHVNSTHEIIGLVEDLKAKLNQVGEGLDDAIIIEGRKVIIESARKIIVKKHRT